MSDSTRPDLFDGLKDALQPDRARTLGQVSYRCLRPAVTVRGMPYGLLIGVLIFGLLALLTLTAPRRPPPLASLAFRVASVYNEVPLLFAYMLVATVIPELLGGRFTSTAGWGVFGLAVLVIIGFLVIAWRSTTARPVVERSLDDGLGIGWRDKLDPELLTGLRTRPPLGNILFFPFVLRPRGVARERDISYGDARRYNLLDVYFPRSRPNGAPVLVYFHGGGFYGGRKSVEGRALLFRLASQGWVTISANYRLRPQARFFEHLIDVKKVIAWVRQHGHEYGADPSTLVLSGGSSGGTLSSIAALTQNDPKYQPGFETADTSVTAVASLYGWYSGYYEMGEPESETGVLGHDPGEAPPFFVAHGEKDSLSFVETARRFVAHLRSGSSNPVVYVELPYGQHAFDLFHSFRFSAVVDGIEAFTSWFRSERVES